MNEILVLIRLFSNINALQELIHLLLNDLNRFIEICSIPNISQLKPVQLNISDTGKNSFIPRRH